MSSTTTLACFEKPFTISYPKPELPPVMMTSSSLPGPKAKGAPGLPKTFQLFQAMLFSAPLMRRSTPTLVKTFKMVIKAASLAGPFFARRFVLKGRSICSLKGRGPRVRRYSSVPVTKGSWMAPFNVEVTAEAISIDCVKAMSFVRGFCTSAVLSLDLVRSYHHAYTSRMSNISRLEPCRNVRGTKERLRRNIKISLVVPRIVVHGRRKLSDQSLASRPRELTWPAGYSSEEHH